MVDLSSIEREIGTAEAKARVFSQTGVAVDYTPFIRIALKLLVFYLRYLTGPKKIETKHE